MIANARNNEQTLSTVTNERVEKLMVNEDALMDFVVSVNKIYQEKIKQAAPFMTFVICGMQSTGKSTIMERFMGTVLNIVQEGTGTRCPLDVTCIHDECASEPVCRMWGDEVEDTADEDLTIEDVFRKIMAHNKRLESEDRFSAICLYLTFKSKNVQNLRFVDTPGIISNASTGKDCREDIMNILKVKMEEPSSKLCVLLEPKEFATNDIINFCDETFGSRERWVHNSIFLMNKFDKQMNDARSGSKANGFFKEFNDNNIYPHLIMTPTLDKETIPVQQLYKERQKILDFASKYEDDKFKAWLQNHKLFLRNNKNDQLLDSKTEEKIGFQSARDCIQKVMLEDVIRCIPEVLNVLKKELSESKNLRNELMEKKKFTDPSRLRGFADIAVREVNSRVNEYLDGNLNVAMKFPEKLQTLHDEVRGEDKSDWVNERLNHYSDLEHDWRSKVASLENKYPDYIDANKHVLGGKQVQRAIEFFKFVMVESLPDPKDVKSMISTSTGYLNDGINVENWEGAVKQIVQAEKKHSHTGVNYLIKHICFIFQRLYPIALADLKHDGELSDKFKILPKELEEHWIREYDKMLMKLMTSAVDNIHSSMEPMYSTLDPKLISPIHDVTNCSSIFREAATERSISKGKGALHDIIKSQVISKTSFLSGGRSGMITGSESDEILEASYKYILDLTLYSFRNLQCHVNHYLYESLKREMTITFTPSDFDWGAIKVDPMLAKNLKEVEEKIADIEKTLKQVQHM